MPEPTTTAAQAAADLAITLCEIATSVENYDRENREAVMADLATILLAQRTGNDTLLANIMTTVVEDAKAVDDYYRYRSDEMSVLAHKAVALATVVLYMLTGSVE